MRLLFLVLAAALLSGCAEYDAFKYLYSSVQSIFSGEDNAEPPKELQPLEPSVQLTVLWDATVGSGYEDQMVNLVPAVSEDRVYVADREGEVHAYDRLKGDLIWSVETELALSSGPVLAGDKLLFGTSNAELMAFSIMDGSLAWKTVLSSEVLALPRVSGGLVVVRTSDGRITALDSGTGASRWSYDRSIPPLSVRSLGSPAIAGDLVLDGFGGGKLLALGLADGKVAWETTVFIPHGRSEIERLVEMDADPLVRGDTVIVSGYQAGVAAVNLRDGEVLWRQQRVFSSHGLASDRRSLFLSDVSSDVWALDPGNGADLWKQSELHQRRLTVPTLVRDQLLVGDLEGWVHALSKEDGSLVGRVQVDDEPIRARPVKFGDVAYIYTSGGVLAAVAVE